MDPIWLSSAAPAIAGAAWVGVAVALVVRKIRENRHQEEKTLRTIASRSEE